MQLLLLLRLICMPPPQVSVQLSHSDQSQTSKVVMEDVVVLVVVETLEMLLELERSLSKELSAEIVVHCSAKLTADSNLI